MVIGVGNVHETKPMYSLHGFTGVLWGFDIHLIFPKTYHRWWLNQYPRIDLMRINCVLRLLV